LWTGFEIHGTLSFIGYEAAVDLHIYFAWSLVILIVFAAFWHFTTGEWRQYRPTSSRLREMFRYYLVGIFRNEAHPIKRTEISKLNPLQRLTYLGLKILMFPVQLISGFLYYYYNQLHAAGFEYSLGTVAAVHTAAAFALLAFVIAHVYLTTTGHTVLGNVKAMITGYETVEEDSVTA
jgi:thiosulfate reductase cytochrome b subunit